MTTKLDRFQVNLRQPAHSEVKLLAEFEGTSQSKMIAKLVEAGLRTDWFQALLEQAQQELEPEPDEQQLFVRDAQGREGWIIWKD